MPCGQFPNFQNLQYCLFPMYLVVFFFNRPSAIAFSVSFCEPLYPCVSLWCVQEFSDAILEWQPSLQAWLRSMELILVPRVKGERESMCSAKRLSCPRLRAVWCYQTHHISPLKPLFVCLHNKCLPRYSDKENMKVTFHWWQGSVYNCNHITISPCSRSLFYSIPRT